MSKVMNVTDANFQDEVLKSDKPVLVDFWASWCAPCRMLAPTIDDVAGDFEDRAKVVKLDVDSNGDTAAKYNIKGIPTLLLFKDGVIKEQIVGATSKENIARMIEAQL
jgi:thioredoxin 1